MSVRPSVCLSVTLVYCVETTELIIKQLALDCSQRTLVDRHQTWNISLYGTPSATPPPLSPLIGGVRWERGVVTPGLAHMFTYMNFHYIRHNRLPTRAVRKTIAHTHTHSDCDVAGDVWRTLRNRSRCCVDLIAGRLYGLNLSF